MMRLSGIVKDKQRLWQILKSEAFFREKIILSSGKESDYYFDARRVTLSAEGAYLSAKIILEMIKNEDIVAIGGPTLGADPLVGAIALLSYQRKKPLQTFIVRKAPKPHGKQQQLEGPPVPEDAEVILIDDVATTGKAFLEAMDVLSRYRIRVRKAICLIDREEGAKQALAQRGCHLASIFRASDFLE